MNLKEFIRRPTPVRIGFFIILILIAVFMWNNYSSFEQILWNGTLHEFGQEKFENEYHSENYYSEKEITEEIIIQEYVKSNNNLISNFFMSDIGPLIFYVLAGIISAIYLVIHLPAVFIVFTGIFGFISELAPILNMPLFVVFLVFDAAYLYFISGVITEKITKYNQKKK